MQKEWLINNCGVSRGGDEGKVIMQRKVEA